MSILFFYYPFNTPPFILSYPTRRSSDLPIIDALRRRAQEYFKGDPLHTPARIERQQHEDRKSTRLNSSHLVISYAVFCLKKKIFNQKRTYFFTYSYLFLLLH